MPEPMKRPMEGWYLRDALKKLAEICALADGLRSDLKPLSDEDIAAGAETVETEEIMSDLQQISLIATSLALEEMQATPQEWYAANDSIE